MKYRNTCVWAPFLSDTGAPVNYLNEGTFAALGFKEHIPESATVKINGVNAPVRLAVAHFEGLNIIGQSFKISGGVEETFNYVTGDVTMKQ